MRTIYLSIGLLASTLAFAQESPKKDSEKTKDIKEVTLTKKVFHKKADRMVYDVASSPIAKGTNAFDLLKETPLVSTTDEKSLKILGKNDVIIYINGRKSNMSPEAVIEMMKNMSSENIQRIEVITVPSSEFAVEGNQGIINIVLKKKPTDGINGNLKFENAQRYFNSQSAVASLNYRKGKFGMNTSINFGANNRRQTMFLTNGNDNAFRQTSEGNIDELSKDFGGYINADYQITEKQNIGLFYSNGEYRSDALKTNLYNIYTDLKTNTKSYTRTENNGTSTSSNNTVTLNYELKTDDKGSKISASSSYLNYRKKEDIMSSTYKQNANQNDVSTALRFSQEIPMKVDNYGILVDYIQKLKKDYTLSIGASYNDTKTDSDTKNIKLIPPTGADAKASNHFIYTERIPSFYTTVEKNFGEKWATKLGIRYEITQATGNVVNENKTFDRNNNNFLPFASVNYNPNQNHSFSYSFSSRVERPQFWAISPTKIFLTATNYVQNNPFAKPESYYNQEFMYMYKSAYFLNLNYSYVKNASDQIPLQGIKTATGENVLAYIRNNYGNKQEMSVSVGMQKQFFKGIWNANNSFFVGRNIYKGEVTGDPTDTYNEIVFNRNVIDFSTTYFGVNLNNNIRLSSKKDLFLGVNYNYLSGLMIEIGKLEPFHGLDLSIKKMWNDFTFNFSARDIFHTSEIKIRGIQSNGDYNFIDQNQYKRRFVATITYNFGNKKLQKAREIEGANKDIKNRTGN